MQQGISMTNMLLRGKHWSISRLDTFYSNMQGALLAIQYLLYYLPNNKGNVFRDEMKSFFSKNITEDIKPMVGYLEQIPWLTEKL